MDPALFVRLEEYVRDTETVLRHRTVIGSTLSPVGRAVSGLRFWLALDIRIAWEITHVRRAEATICAHYALLTMETRKEGRISLSLDHAGNVSLQL